MTSGTQMSERGGPFEIERGLPPPAVDNPASFSRPSKPVDQFREALPWRHYSPRTEQTYCHWVKRYIFFHKVCHPAEMVEPEVNDLLTHLAVTGAERKGG
ncbi:MAG: phage integrase N-terminal SAM-like domain-containing protein [bacterium]